MRLERKIAAIAALLVVVFLVGACGGSDGVEAGRADRAADLSDGGGGGGGSEAGERGLVLEGGYAADSDASAPQPVALGENDVTTQDAFQEREAVLLGPSVIKTADMRLEIAKDDFRTAVREATMVAERYGGFVVSSAVDDSRRGSASATLRVPADRFAAALGSLRELGTVNREEIGGEDVSQELIDLEARLRNYRAQERVLLDLMADAQSVADTIRVQNELSGIQLQVERLRGRLRYLNDQVTYSTIFVNMREKGAPPAPRSGAIHQAWNNAVEGFFAVIGAVITAAGVLVPVGLLALIAFLGIRWLRPRVVRRLGTQKA